MFIGKRAQILIQAALWVTEQLKQMLEIHLYLSNLKTYVDLFILNEVQGYSYKLTPSALLQDFPDVYKAILLMWLGPASKE